MRPAGKASRISPALLVAIVALVASLGGGAVAGVAVNALNKKEKKQVRKISKKQAKKQVRKVPAGPRGATGPQGIAGTPGIAGQVGTTGPQGDPGLSGLERVTSQSANNSVSEKVISADCPEGKSAIGAGFDLSGGKSGTPPNHYSGVVADSLTILPDSASIEAFESGSGTSGSWRVSLTVTCATVP